MSHHFCLQQSAPTIILWKTNTEVDFLNFLLEEVLLVEEEDDGGGCKELVVTDAVEQVQRLMHAILGRKRGKQQISLWGGCLFIPVLTEQASVPNKKGKQGNRSSVFSMVGDNQTFKFPFCHFNSLIRGRLFTSRVSVPL